MVVRFFILVLAIVATSPAAAQFIDYELLFKDKADQLTERSMTDGKIVTDLRLDHGVVVTRQPDGNYISFTTAKAAPGCFFEVLVSLDALAQVCTSAFGVERQQNLTKMIEAFSGYMARNAYPPMSQSKALEIAKAKTNTIKNQISKTQSCSSDGNSDLNGWLRMADALTKGVERDAVNELPDMLPVTNPCL